MVSEMINLIFFLNLLFSSFSLIYDFGTILVYIYWRGIGRVELPLYCIVEVKLSVHIDFGVLGISLGKFKGLNRYMRK